ncbi:hypothetical protein CDD80_5932 [Ophiocordyceps camponoti-rufipedis]|uniref:Cysteine-rich PDZ-binding protein n=1 Tax=Ophiocordyceps camponoti-rufipedis TaxID=2004952 RepID=A0A2C5YTB0_9HYPO|nr:hypothetical protein CDD80_5932 [Ophiocordyceps camponoti-rufipedis]
MVCAKCQKLKSTTLATPEVKKKNDIYYGSPASTSSSKTTTTLGNSGIAKARSSLPPFPCPKNPYAQYSSSCTKCKTKITQGHAFCHTCAYKNDACAMCGKPNKKTTSKAPVVAGQKFTLK